MKYKYLLLLFGLYVFLSSCRTPRFVYSPSTPNNPYFQKKGESKLAAYYSATGTADEIPNEYNNGFDMQAAYAPGNHWALTADYFSRREKDIFTFNPDNYYDSSVVKYDRHITSFGAGYFTPIQKNSNVFLNVFAGIGSGKFNFTDNGTNNGVNYSRYHNADITTWYIQPAVNIYFRDYIRTAFIGQIKWVYYGNITTSYFESELNYFDLNQMPGKTLSFFAGTWNIQATIPKMNWLYLDGSLTISSEPLGKDLNIEARNTVVSIGLSIDFSKIKKGEN